MAAVARDCPRTPRAKSITARPRCGPRTAQGLIPTSFRQKKCGVRSRPALQYQAALGRLGEGKKGYSARSRSSSISDSQHPPQSPFSASSLLITLKSRIALPGDAEMAHIVPLAVSPPLLWLIIWDPKILFLCLQGNHFTAAREACESTRRLRSPLLLLVDDAGRVSGAER